VTVSSTSSVRPAARAAVHQHLRNIAAMRLIFRQIEHHLHGTLDVAGRVLRDQQCALAAFRAPDDPLPKIQCLAARQRPHEAYRRPALDAVDQHVRQRGNQPGLIAGHAHMDMIGSAHH
jgi:hypothetical protein